MYFTLSSFSAGQRQSVRKKDDASSLLRGCLTGSFFSSAAQKGLDKDMKIIPVFDRAIVNPADGDVLEGVIQKNKNKNVLQHLLLPRWFYFCINKETVALRGGLNVLF